MNTAEGNVGQIHVPVITAQCRLKAIFYSRCLKNLYKIKKAVIKLNSKTNAKITCS